MKIKARVPAKKETPAKEKTGPGPKKGKRRRRNAQTRGRSSQRKGKAFQHALAEIFAIATGFPREEFQSNHGGKKGEVDVIRSSAAQEVFPFRVEAKNNKTLQIPAWWRQLQKDKQAEKCEDPGIIVSRLYGKEGQGQALVTMSLIEFLDLLYDLNEDQKAKISHLQALKPKKDMP